MNEELKDNAILFLEWKYNFPIESVKGRPISNFIRKLIHTRRIMRYKTWREKGGCKISNPSKECL